ncbi:MAG TPA: glycoside hydrolase family 71/99-like protein [Pseudomonadales bacterium]|nr:glycoside hydrolase family 71/99-like protein [Pseudomonadales bacterium]
MAAAIDRANGLALGFLKFKSPLKVQAFWSAILVAALFLGAPAVTHAGTKPVMTHYMPWFESQAIYGSWGWHWSMNHFNPNAYNAGYREIASWYYPQVGPYDSSDPNVLECHVLLMKLAGIDGVIADWYGMDNYNDYGLINQRTIDLFSELQKAGMQFCLCYEDATIQQEINGGFITAPNAVAHGQQTMLYVQTNYFALPGYLRLNNLPVLLNFGPQYFTSSSQWTSIFSVLNSTNQPAFFTEDNRLYPVGQGAFDWPPMGLSSQGILSDATLQNYLATFDQKGSVWPAYVSTAFPRFHDIYAQAGVGSSYGYLDDQNGKTLRETLARAMTNASAVVQIATWNDFGEGTVIEPTVSGVAGCALVDTNAPTTVYGYTDLGIIQDSRRQYLNSSFPYHTNDLALPLQLFSLRELFGNSNPIATAELNRVFSNIVSGNLSTARLQLNGVQAGAPVIYNLSLTNNQLQFFVGGYLSQSGIQVQVSSNLVNWKSISNLSVTTNQVIFSTSAAPGSAPSFFRIQND